MTLGVVEFYNKDTVTLGYTAEVPVSQVAFTKDENGRTIPLDFTAIAAQVTPAVVHIKSTQNGRVQETVEKLTKCRETCMSISS